ncbi:MAG TPA: general secretion pathway protein GspB [Woeseiaceae bacterium]|nr:general secretion pathway protein GspB [Woeseiaceae bacterium]
MSFILDALRKSESERQRRSTPGIADVPEGTRRRGVPRWSWLLGALLAVNAAVLAGLWLRPAPRTSPAPSPTAADADGRSFAALVAAARESQPAPPANGTPAAARQPASAAGETPAAAPPADRAGTATAAATDMPMPTFNELRARGTLQLPDLHLDIHVYSDKPAQRFVFVNMQKYREQGRLDEGPLVREITADGVILEFSGTQFLLPRE